MDKAQVITHLLCGTERDDLALIYNYCIDMGKSIKLSKLFIELLLCSFEGHMQINHCKQYAIQYYTNKYQIVLVYDKNNKLIYAY